jgi:hypothetical protein
MRQVVVISGRTAILSSQEVESLLLADGEI